MKNHGTRGTRKTKKKTHTHTKWHWGNFTVFFKKMLPRRVSAEHLAGFHERDHTGSIFTLFTLFFNKKEKGGSIFFLGGWAGSPSPVFPVVLKKRVKRVKMLGVAAAVTNEDRRANLTTHAGAWGAKKVKTPHSRVLVIALAPLRPSFLRGDVRQAGSVGGLQDRNQPGHLREVRLPT